MVTTDDVGVGGKQGACADGHAARREDLAVEADVGAVVDQDVAGLVHEERLVPAAHQKEN